LRNFAVHKVVKRILHTGLVAVLALLLVFGSTSKEYIHLFADHTDTTHCHSNHDHDGLSFESEHHHDAASYQLRFLPTYITSHDAEEVAHLTPREVPASRLRGPPVI
jgi:hypothetical protein